jgi:hypothetical protein
LTGVTTDAGLVAAGEVAADVVVLAGETTGGALGGCVEVAELPHALTPAASPVTTAAKARRAARPGGRRDVITVSIIAAVPAGSVRDGI